MADLELAEALAHVLRLAGDKVEDMERCFEDTGDRDVEEDYNYSRRLLKKVEEWWQGEV